MENEYLAKKYKECCDNNNKSGRGKMEFKWYDQLDEIFGKNKNAIVAHTISSKVTAKKGQKDITNCASKSSSPDVVIHDSTSPSVSTATISDSTSPSASTATISVTSPLMNNKNTARSPHGTGSNLANKKVHLEQQWLKFLATKEIRDTARDERHMKSEERAIESFTLKKQMVALKRKQIEQKKELSIKRLKDKENRHTEIIKIEKTKCKLLKKLLNQANINNISDDSDE